MSKPPVVVSYGGGVNSVAMLVGLVARNERPNLILFADTGGELPETIDYRDNFSIWLVDRGFPEITVVSNQGKYKTLETQCNVTGFLPSIAYGGGTCSIKYKQEPMDRYVRDRFGTGQKVVRLIGYDAGETRRGESITEDDRYIYRFPLKEWGWDRKDCVHAILDAGLCVPPKSSCFFCPAMRKHEVRRLAKEHPELYERALAIEENAMARKELEGRTDGPVGLGRDWSWREVVEADRAQLRLFHDPPPLPCLCWDGQGDANSEDAQ